MSCDVQVYFNFRSPYCYLVSKRFFDVADRFDIDFVWRPLGGWDGRSPPERAAVKVPLARQDLARFARRMGIPVKPPPKETDPTRAGAGSLLAEEKGLLRPYVVEVMRREWAEGCDIGALDVLLDVGAGVGLDRAELAQAVDDPARRATLAENREEAVSKGVIGVPSFVVGDEIFWGNDRLEFLEDHLREMRLARL